MNHDQLILEMGYSSGARFSPCFKHRYALWRIWDTSKLHVMFVGLNPSTANGTKDDPTIRRIKNLVNSWGYGGFYMLNLYSFITPYPKELKKCIDPIAVNDTYLIEFACKCASIIYAFGSFHEANERANRVIRLLGDGYCLGINKDGSPKHPLYVKKETELIKYNFNGK